MHYGNLVFQFDMRQKFIKIETSQYKCTIEHMGLFQYWCVFLGYLFYCVGIWSTKKACS